MSLDPIGRVAATAVAGVVVLFLAAAGNTSSRAESDGFWSWGGETKVNGTGKKLVSIRTDAKPGDVVVSFGDRRLYLMIKPDAAYSYPIAIPRDQSRWEGNTQVTMKRENPPWTPTPEMKRENPHLPSWVPGGHPMNPLGVRALYLGSSAYRIHGTDAPWTIGSAASKGCVRMFNQDVIDLYPQVKVGAKVIVTWKRFETSEAMVDAPLQPKLDTPQAPAATPPPPVAAAKAAPVASQRRMETVPDASSGPAPIAAKPGELLISLADRRAYLVTASGSLVSYPITLPADLRHWRTAMRVSSRRGSQRLSLGSDRATIIASDDVLAATGAKAGAARMSASDLSDLSNRVALGAKVTATWRKLEQLADARQ